jgi:hypothetical protein
MKRSIFMALLGFAVMTAFAADNTSLSGKWKIHSSIVGNESDSECTLTQSNNELTGTCKTAEGKDAKATGKVDGTKVNWSFDSEYNGTPLTMNYTGTLDPATSKIAGTVSVDPFGVDGDFTATSVK